MIISKMKLNELTETSYKIRNDLDDVIEILLHKALSHNGAYIMHRALRATRNDLQDIIDSLEYATEARPYDHIEDFSYRQIQQLQKVADMMARKFATKHHGIAAFDYLFGIKKGLYYGLALGISISVGAVDYDINTIDGILDTLVEENLAFSRSKRMWTTDQED